MAIYVCSLVSAVSDPMPVRGRLVELESGTTFTVPPGGEQWSCQIKRGHKLLLDLSNDEVFYVHVYRGALCFLSFYLRGTEFKLGYR